MVSCGLHQCRTHTHTHVINDSLHFISPPRLGNIVTFSTLVLVFTVVSLTADWAVGVIMTCGKGGGTLLHAGFLTALSY